MLVRDNQLCIDKKHIQQLNSGELNWIDLLTDCKLEHAAIEYIDAEEQNKAFIAMYPKYMYESTILKQSREPEQ